MTLLPALAHPLLLLALFSAWVWCLVDALKGHRPWGWVIFVAVFPVVSVPFYFLNYKVFGSGKSGLVDEEIRWARRLRELEEQARETDVVGVHREIADLHFQRGHHRRALESLKRVLDQDPEDLRSQFQAGASMISLGHLDAGITHLQYVVEEDPRYAAGEAKLWLANAYIAKGESAQAFSLLAELTRDHNLPQAAIRYARMLEEQGYTGEARARLQEMLEKSEDLTGEQKRKNQRWINEGRKMLDRLGESSGTK
jgi:hypothetical protein